ncbi:MAG: exodeoxyribonuclease III [Acidimicrobiia bacterium]|nr:exodeoxyribonuclease III [Acidimicrobiia bacterium]
MRFITYNVNSITARLPRLLALLDEVDPDIVCVQETKVAVDAFPHLALRSVGYVAADYSGGRWNGVAILARSEIGFDDLKMGLHGEVVTDEARWVEASVGGIRVVSAYVPNGQAVGSEPFAQKLAFLEAMGRRSRQLVDQPAIIAGDLNVCPTDLDVWDPAEIHGATHITDEERSRLAVVVDNGFVDTFRALHPTEPGFTWWDYRFGAFHKGHGLRIDHVLASAPLAGRLRTAGINRDFRKPSKVPESKPSDHAPLIVEFE